MPLFTFFIELYSISVIFLQYDEICLFLNLIIVLFLIIIELA